MKRIVSVLAVAAIATLVMFEVDIDPRFRLAGTETRVDPAQETRYETCVEESERAFHQQTFAEVDNPDVQRELLYRQSQEAKSSCRAEHPRRTIEVDVPMDFNLFDLTWRF